MRDMDVIVMVSRGLDMDLENSGEVGEGIRVYGVNVNEEMFLGTFLQVQKDEVGASRLDSCARIHHGMYRCAWRIKCMCLRS